MKKKLLIAGGIVLVVLIGMFFFVTNGLAEGAKVPLSGISLSNVQDGSYTGVYEFKRWSNTVVVQIENHKIIAVDTENKLAGVDPAELFRRVIEAQDTRVDAVSGATVTSRAYLKAIENAFSNQ